MPPGSEDDVWGLNKHLILVQINKHSLLISGPYGVKLILEILLQELMVNLLI